MATINSATQAEILRKARSGISLTNPTKETSALYSSYKQPTAVTKTITTAGNGAKSALSPVNPTVGLNISGGYTGANDTEKGLADAGKAWAAATSQAERDAAHARATQIGQAAGWSYDSHTGSWSAPQAKAEAAQDPGAQGAVNYNPSPSGPSGSDLINNAYQNNYAAQLQKLKAARDQSLAALAGQDNLIHQSAYDNRNSNDVVANQRLTALKEAMANMGLGASGDSVTGQIAVGTDRQQSANGINNNEGNQIQQLTAQRDAINNNANADDFALMQQLQAARDTALVNQGNADRGYGLDLGQALGNINGQRTLSGQQFDYGKTTDQRNFDYSKGIDQRNFDYSKGIDQRNFDFQKATQEWNQTFQQGQFDYQKASDVWERAFKDKSFDQSVKQFAQSMGLNWAQLNQSQQHFVADQAFKNKSFDLQQSEFNWSKDSNNPDNKYKNWQSDPSNPNNIQPGTKATTYDQAYKDIDSSPFIANFGGQPIVKDQKGLGDYIFSLGLPEADTRKLYQRYGIQWGG